MTQYEIPKYEIPKFDVTAIPLADVDSATKQEIDNLYRQDPENTENVKVVDYLVSDGVPGVIALAKESSKLVAVQMATLNKASGRTDSEGRPLACISLGNPGLSSKFYSDLHQADEAASAIVTALTQKEVVEPLPVGTMPFGTPIAIEIGIDLTGDNLQRTPVQYDPLDEAFLTIAAKNGWEKTPDTRKSNLAIKLSDTGILTAGVFSFTAADLVFGDETQDVAIESTTMLNDFASGEAGVRYINQFLEELGDGAHTRIIETMKSRGANENEIASMGNSIEDLIQYLQLGQVVRCNLDPQEVDYFSGQLKDIALNKRMKISKSIAGMVTFKTPYTVQDTSNS